MADEEIDNVFKDFKFEDSKEPSHDEVKKQAQKEFNKTSFTETEEPDHGAEIRELKKQVRELKHHITKPKEEATFKKEQKHEVKHAEHKPEPKHTIKHAEHKPEPKPTKHFEPKHDFSPKTAPNSLERKVLVGVIIILLAFIAIDLTFYHGSKTTKTADKAEPGIIGAVTVTNETKEENKTAKAVVNETEEDKTTETENKTTEEKKLSGKIEIQINKIYSIKENDNKGYINKVSFTIKNGKDKILKPVVKVYAYDKNSEEPWMERDRGEFIYSIGIVPGGEQAGSVDLYPRTFADLDVLKTVVLKLFDEDDDVIASVQDKFYIK